MTRTEKKTENGKKERKKERFMSTLIHEYNNSIGKEQMDYRFPTSTKIP